MPKITPVNIWVFDFDDTLVHGHVDFYISTKILEINLSLPAMNYLPGNHTNPFFTHKNVTPYGIPMIPENIVSEQCYKHLRSIDNKERIDLKHPEKMLELMKKILANGDKIAIATFSRYPDVIKLYLTELGLTTDELENIIIEHGLPEDGGRTHGKNKHIEKIVTEIEHKNPGITIGTITLVDDSPNNVEKAEGEGYKVITVPQNNTDTKFLEDIEKEIGLQAANEAEAQGHVVAAEAGGVAAPAGGASSSGGARPITRTAGVGPSTTPLLFSEASLAELRTAFRNIEKFLIDRGFTSIDSKKLRESLDKNKFSKEFVKRVFEECSSLPLQEMSGLINAYCKAMEDLASSPPPNQTTILQRAIIDNAITDEEIRTLPNELLTITDIEGNTPLHTAIQCLRPSLARALVARLEDDNLASQNAEGNTPLHLIAQTIRKGKKPIEISAVEKLVDVARLIIARLGNNIATVNHTGNTPLHLAAYDGNRDIAVLLAQGMTPNQLAIKTSSGYSALQIAEIYCCHTRGEDDGLKKATFEELEKIYETRAKTAHSHAEAVRASQGSFPHSR
jgi:FMN phosphatase YigB (HAD superfamily)